MLGGSNPEVVDKPIPLTDSNFQETLRQHRLLLVDFWAPWCGPCRMVAPVIEELAGRYAGSAVFGKLNTDENPKTAMKYGISAIPTLIVFKNGEEVDRMVGAAPKAEIEALLQKHLQT
ncbi:thioredoxin [Candidatus Hecatella orcuttiae]|uniref:thioredoxin n=1 Tax=Candidatus Hecatella orcuttiae TaxID=1935119 RepID=UPI003184538D